jgi:manganese-dependent inorganic pyrophosphatase
VQSYGKQVVEAGAGIDTRDPKDIVGTDLKLYEAGGLRFAIAQAEVTNLMQVKDRLEVLKEALNELRSQRGLDFAMLMITDVVDNTSLLIVVNMPPLMEDLPYPVQADGTYQADGVHAAPRGE